VVEKRVLKNFLMTGYVIKLLCSFIFLSTWQSFLFDSLVLGLVLIDAQFMKLFILNKDISPSK